MSGENGDAERWKDNIEKRIDDLESGVDSLNKWRAWLIGVTAGVGLIVGTFARQIAVVLKQMFGAS